MSNTDQTTSDDSVVAELRKLGAGTTTGAKFPWALELGASPALLEQLAVNYLERNDPANDYRVTGLPYIDVLLAGGWSLGRVREFVEQQCFTERYNNEDRSHRHGFLNSEDAWRVCETAEQLFGILRQIAECDPGYVMQPDVRKRFLGYAGELRLDSQRNERDMLDVEEVAASQLESIQSAHQLTIMLRVVDRKRPRERFDMMYRLAAPGGWNAVFLGYLLCKYGASSNSAMWSAISMMTRRLEDCPWQGADMLRWLIMGFQLANHQYWQFALEGSDIQSLFIRQGWYIVPVTTGPGGALQAVFTAKGQRITFVHRPGDEPLQVGDEVIVSPVQPKLLGLVPQHSPGGARYTITLIPARPPTDAMLLGPGKTFWVDPHDKLGRRKLLNG